MGKGGIELMKATKQRPAIEDEIPSLDDLPFLSREIRHVEHRRCLAETTATIDVLVTNPKIRERAMAVREHRRVMLKGLCFMPTSGHMTQCAFGIGKKAFDYYYTINLVGVAAPIKSRRKRVEARRA